MSENQTRWSLLKELIGFFEDSLKDDPVATTDWVIQGDWDSDDFIAAVRKLKRDLGFRIQ